MYRAYGMLPSDTDFTLDEAETRLRARFPAFQVSRVGAEVHATAGEWELKLRVNDDPYVAVESVGLAEKIAGLEPAEAAAVEACGRRVELWSDTQDPFVEHLADFHAAVAVLKSFRGLIAIDPADHTLM